MASVLLPFETLESILSSSDKQPTNRSSSSALEEATGGILLFVMVGLAPDASDKQLIN